MANLLSQNIGTNYKSILNLDATTINTPLDATLRAVTDGMGTSSPLQLSTGQAAIINGSNYKGLFIGGGVASVKYSSGTDHTANGWMSGLNGNSSAYYSIAFGTSALYSTSALAINTDLNVLINRNLYIGFNDAAFPTPSARLQIKGVGTTSATTSFIVQNSSGIDLFRVYDNSGIVGQGARFGDISIGNYAFQGLNVKEIANIGANIAMQATGGTGVSIGTLTLLSSAVLQADSTTKGFLPPRMTSTQKNAIVSPAAGLIIYDTTLNKLAVFTTAWETVTSI